MHLLTHKAVAELIESIRIREQSLGQTLPGETSIIFLHLSSGKIASVREAIVGKYRTCLEKYPFIRFMKTEFLSVHSGLADDLPRLRKRWQEVEKFDREIERIAEILTHLQTVDLLHPAVFFEDHSGKISLRHNLFCMLLNSFLEEALHHHIHCRPKKQNSEPNFDLLEHIRSKDQALAKQTNLSERLENIIFKNFPEYQWLSGVLPDDLKTTLGLRALETVRRWSDMDIPATNTPDLSEWHSYDELVISGNPHEGFTTLIMDEHLEKLEYLNVHLIQLSQRTSAEHLGGLIISSIDSLLILHNLIRRHPLPKAMERFSNQLHHLKSFYTQFLKKSGLSELLITSADEDSLPISVSNLLENLKNLNEAIQIDITGAYAIDLNP